MNKLPTSRLTLRLISLADLQVIHALHALPETDAYNALGIPASIAETQAVITPWVHAHDQPKIQQYTFAIERSSDQQFIGLLALKIGNPKYRKGEVWYKLHSAFWGMGYATEALKRLLTFGFEELQLHRIEAGVAVENIGSIKVLEKVGMIREGRKRKVLPLKSGWSDNFEYGILEGDQR